MLTKSSPWNLKGFDQAFGILRTQKEPAEAVQFHSIDVSCASLRRPLLGYLGGVPRCPVLAETASSQRRQEAALRRWSLVAPRSTILRPSGVLTRGERIDL